MVFVEMRMFGENYRLNLLLELLVIFSKKDSVSATNIMADYE